MLSANDIYFVDHDVTARVARDRAALLRYLSEFLRTGEVVEPPRLEVAYRQIRLDRGREPIGQVAWRWSELTGKYVDCQYWSTEALRVAEAFVRSSERGDLAKACERAASTKNAESIQHEHVFPRAQWAAVVARHVRAGRLPTLDALERMLDRLCIGCVVTRAQHREVDSRVGVEENPWLRYRASSIELVPNLAWSANHAAWIRDAGLLLGR